MSQDVATDCPCGGCNYNVAEDRCGDNCNCEAAPTRPPAAESGTPASGEVSSYLAVLRDAWSQCRHAVGWCDQCQGAALASLLSASPASETPGPGEGDLRGEVDEGECGACQGDEAADLRCPKSRRTCGHHCNHVMTHDACDWCGTAWGEDGAESAAPSDAPRCRYWPSCQHLSTDDCGAPRSGESDVEAIAAKVHEAWMETKRAQGVESRPSEWGEEQMVPYADLTERAKDLDRGSVQAVLTAIDAAGLVLTSRAEKARTDAAVEQRTLAVQKVAHLRALCDEAVSKSRYLNGASVVYTRDVRAILAAPSAALADPEADR